MKDKLYIEVSNDKRKMEQIIEQGKYCLDYVLLGVAAVGAVGFLTAMYYHFKALGVSKRKSELENKLNEKFINDSYIQGIKNQKQNNYLKFI